MIDLTGKRYGRLTVIERGPDADTKRNRIRWKCICDCGNKVMVRPGDLKRGNTKSCGCYWREQHQETRKLPMDTAFKHAIWQRIKSSAKKRRINFTVTIDQVWEVCQLPCHYCGSQPSNKIKHDGQSFTFQGIDRKDSRKGYIPGNILPCCQHCNVEKGSKSYKWYMEFRRFWQGNG